MLVERLVTAAIVLVAIVVVGAVGFHGIGASAGKDWEWGDCLYMTIITLSTVGFGETLPGMDAMGSARIWTVALILVGSGTLVYFVSTFTALLVDTDIRGMLRVNRMQSKIDALSGHVIVCGVSQTGAHIVEELVATKTPFVVVDLSTEHIEKLLHDFPSVEILYVIGDASDDEVLTQAGIMRCKGLVCALGDDRDNLFVTVSAHSLNASSRIVAECVAPSAVEKLRRAGANAIVQPNRIGGMRIASEMLRPQVVEFLDQMLRDKGRSFRIEEATISAGSKLVGRAFRDAEWSAHTNALIIAARPKDGSIVHNPPSTMALEAGMTLIALGDVGEVEKLRTFVGS